MKKIYYEKVGQKYVPVAEYDGDFMDSFHKGNHLVMVYPGGQSRRFNIDPAYAPMIAASRTALANMTKAMQKASELKPQQTLITIGQRKAWKKLSKELGDELCILQGPSLQDIAEAGINALVTESKVLLTNPAAKKAYEHFLLVCELTKE